jgi:Tol biopolymer transport system component
MNYKPTYIIFGILVCFILGATFFVHNNGEVVIKAEAANYSFSFNGELYTVDSTGKTKKLTNSKDVKYVFGESDELILFGKNYTAQNNHSNGMSLFVMKKGNGEAKKVTSEIVEFALLDTAKKNILFLTPDGKIKKQGLGNGNTEVVAELASIPSISPDDKFLAFKKMPQGWVSGAYSEGSPGIVIKEIATGKERVLADKEADHAAFWTPDGKYLYFFGDNGFGFDSLFIVNNDGTERTLLTNIGLSEYNPEVVIPSISEPPIISNDGRFFVYESDREIWLVETDLKNKKVIAARRIAYGISPRWKKDSELISIVAGGDMLKDELSMVLVDMYGNLISQ